MPESSVETTKETSPRWECVAVLTNGVGKFSVLEQHDGSGQYRVNVLEMNRDTE